MGIVRALVGAVAMIVLSVSYVSATHLCNYYQNEYIELSFIASEEELVSAEQALGSKGIAVSAAFYSATSPEIQTRINLLMAYVATLEYRPLIVYGQPFDHELARKLLVFENGQSCEPTVYVGIVKKSSSGYGFMCGAYDKLLGEARIRKLIEKAWFGSARALFEHKD